MHLYITLPTGKIHSAIVQDDASLRALLMDLHASQGDEANGLTLLFKGRPIDKNISLAKQNISDGCLITTTFTDGHDTDNQFAAHRSLSIFVVDSEGQQRKVEVTSADTIQNICDRVFGNNTGSHTLLFMGLSANPNFTIETCGIKDGSILMSPEKFPM